MGIALQNFLTRAMKFSKTGNESLLPLSFYAGSRFNMFNDRISLFNSINARGFNVGTEIEIEKLLIQRSEIDNKIDLGVLMSASLLFNSGISIKRINKIIEVYPNIIETKLNVDDIIKIDGFQTKIASQFIDNLEKFNIVDARLKNQII